MGIFKAYDVRGVFGDDLTLDKAFLIGYYFVKLNSINKLVVGFDCRDSSEVLFMALTQGLVRAGAKVDVIGRVSTPAFYYSLFERGGTGIMITASHNPKEYNGFKIVKDLEGYDSSSGLKDLEGAVNNDPERVASDFDAGLIKEMSYEDFLDDLPDVVEIIDSYRDYLKNKVSEILDERDILFLKEKVIAFDFSNGMSGRYMANLFSELGFKCLFFNKEENGEFPGHSPDPLKSEDYVKGIAKKVDFDVLFCFDGDGDRLGVFTKFGDRIYSDYVIALFIEFFHERMNARRFTYDLRVSKVVKDIIENYNLEGYECRVGRSFIKRSMEEKDCFFGGELSGHLFFKEFSYFDNPHLAVIYLLKIMSVYREDLESLIDKYSSKYYKEKEINLIVDEKDGFFELLKREFKEFLCSDLDGYSFDLGKVWFNVRASNTEPLVRVNIEGYSKEDVEKVKRLILGLLSK